MRYSILLFCLLIASVLNVYADDVPTYKKVTSQEEIVDGGVYVLVGTSNNISWWYGNGFASTYINTSNTNWNATPDPNVAYNLDNAYELSLIKVEDNKYNIKSINDNKYLCINKERSSLSIQNDITDIYYNFIWTFSFLDGYNIIRADGDIQNKITYYSTTSNRYFTYTAANTSNHHPINLYKKIPTVPPSTNITFTSLGCATQCHNKDLDYTDSGAKAYVASIHGNYVYLTEVQKVPAGEAVIVIKDGSNDNITVSEVTMTEDEKTAYNAKGNILKGITADAGLTVDADGQYYALCNVDGEAMFCLLAKGVNIPKGKAYIKIGGDNASPAKLTMQFSTPVSITAPSTTSAATQQAYDISGKPATGKTRGIVIRNGKKSIVR